VPHICYCHSPMRYIWDLYPDYRARAGRLKRLLMAWQSHRLRIWDQLSANRVDHFIANSGFVADRIRSYYRRDSRVIHPPVDTDAFGPAAATDDFYLLYGQLVGYKRADLAIEAFNASGRRLLVIGAGQELTRLKRAARGNIEFLGFQPDAVVRDHLARCRALIFPGVEDFGITPVEAMASGRPVIAFGRGGALDTVREGLSGLFFQQASAADLNRAIDRFEATASQFQPERIREWSKRFDRSVFLRRIGAFIEEFGMPEVDR
jgi:glycosyltransferase involved in cell wall biosynthesis